MNLANDITIIRILLVPIFVALILYSRFNLALAVFLIAVLSDAVDGYIARAFKQKTKLGTMLDPIADKILIISAFICLIFVKDLPYNITIPPYVPIVVITRDALIVLGTVLIYMMKKDVYIAPSILGKITTFFQMLTIISILVQFAYSSIIWNIMVVLTLLSGLDYVVRGSRLLNENHRND